MMPDESAQSDEQRDAIKSEEVKKAFLMRPFPTLGERLANEARRVASRRILVFLWLRPLERMMEHLASLLVPAQERFQRFDALPSGRSIAGSNVSTQGPFRTWGREEGTPVPLQSRAQKAGLDSSTPVSAPMKEGSPLNFSNSSMASDPAGQPLPPHLQQRLQSFVGRGSESLRIHTDAASHALVRAHRADAVTIGQHIFFREGGFRPQEERGFALLTHEALHVVRAMQPDSAWRRATQAGIEEEEQEAAGIESRALEARRNASWEPALLPSQPLLPAQASMLPRRLPPLPPPRMAGPAPLAAESVASAPAPAPAQRPMKASTDRSLDNGGPPAQPDMDALKRSLYRDLMRQIKADLERGG